MLYCQLPLNVIDSMRLPRFFLPYPALAKTITIDGPVARHMIQVLRLTAGSPVILFNGEGGEYHAIINTISKKEVSVEVTEFTSKDVESRLKVTLLQAVSRGERMDYTLQKATELGVTDIKPINTERAVVNLKGDRALKRVSHWQKVVNGACEQCGRNIVPQVQQIENFKDCVLNLANGAYLADGSISADGSFPVNTIKLLLYPEAQQSISSCVKSLSAENLLIILLIGPEGGISQEELDLAIQAGFKMVHLGPRVLRTETAAVVALSILQSILGDLC